MFTKVLRKVVNKYVDNRSGHCGGGGGHCS